MVKISMKSYEKIYNHTNYAFPLRQTCLQRSLWISLLEIMVRQTFLSLSYIWHYSVSVAFHKNQY